MCISPNDFLIISKPVAMKFVVKHETLTATKFERGNQGKEKKIATKQQLKDANIQILKKDNEQGIIDLMDYLMKISSFIAELTLNLLIYIIV